MTPRKLRPLLFAGLALVQSAAATDYHLDPVTGSMANPGTAASPWSTLSAVFAASPAKVFQAGDRLLLLRGYHGDFTLSGINTGDVFIEAAPGHTPTVRLNLLNAQHWYFKGLTILRRVEIDSQTNENSHYNTFENCFLPNGGFAVFSSHITLRGNHIRNGGIHFGFHSNQGLVSRNTIEDFYSDAMNQKGNFGVFEYNLVMNSHKVSGNHNDMFQGWASKGNVLRGNEFRAYSDPNQPDLVQPGLSDVQGIGLFDGWYEDWVIENNVLFVDHAIGIWINGAKRCLVKNNTVVRCGQNAAISTRYPNIRVAAKKPSTAGALGAPSVSNVVINNVAERFELSDADNSGSSIGIASNNIVVPKSAFGSTYLNWSRKDLHLKPGAAAVIDAGTAANSPPPLDADTNPRPFGVAWDCGAFEYGHVTTPDTTAPATPTGLSATIVAGYGVDIHWAPAADDRAVAGYDVFRNGVLAGRTRAGSNYFDINTDTSGSYAVQAFDYSDNKSPMSEAVGGTPPVPDTEAPSVPGGVGAVAQSTTSILVTWSPSTDNVAVTDYEILRGGIKVGRSSGANFTDSDLTPATSYSYAVQARDRAGNVSAASPPANARTLDPDTTPPSAPADVVATPLSSGSIRVQWAAATDNRGVVGYEIYRDGASIDTATGTNCTDVGLSPLTTYAYTVRALDAEGNTSAASSPPALATTLAPVPLLVGESFEYADAANLHGLDGGDGWGGPWSVGYSSSFPALIRSGSLLPSSGLVASGNSLKFWTKGNGNTYQNLDRPFENLIADGGQTVWFALAIATCNAKNAATWTLAGLTTDAAGTVPATLFSTVENGTPMPFKFGATTLFTGDTGFTPHLILVRIEMSGDANAENLTAYADPNLSADPAGWSGVARSLYANDGLVGFAYRGGRASTSTPNTEFFMDEIRIGDTWQAAVGQAEPPTTDSEAPSIPANVAATAQSSSSILITWDASTDNLGVTGYEVYRGGTWVGSTTATSFTDSGLTPATGYSYTVKAKDAADNISAASAAATATTRQPPSSGTIVAAESFDYPANTALNALAGGSGWSGPWIANYNTAGNYLCYQTVGEGNLANRPGLVNAGRHAKILLAGNGTTRGFAERLLANPVTDDGGVFWWAFQIALKDAKNVCHWSLTQPGDAHTDNLITTPIFTTSSDDATVDFKFLGTTIFSGDASITPRLVLVKIAMSGDAEPESLTAYVDPNLEADPLTWTGTTKTAAYNNGFDGLRWASNRASTTSNPVGFLDEIRLATTWQGAVGQSATTPIQTWRRAKFGTTSNTGDAADDADPNHNGIVNLLEYALGGDPAGGTTGTDILPQAGRSAGNALQINFTRYLDRTDLTLTVQAADSPTGPWTDLATSTAGAAFAPATRATESGTGKVRTVVVTDLHSMDDPEHRRRFMRFKAEH